MSCGWVVGECGHDGVGKEEEDELVGGCFVREPILARAVGGGGCEGPGREFVVLKESNRSDSM